MNTLLDLDSGRGYLAADLGLLWGRSGFALGSTCSRFGRRFEVDQSPMLGSIWAESAVGLSALRGRFGVMLGRLVLVFGESVCGRVGWSWTRFRVKSDPIAGSTIG